MFAGCSADQASGRSGIAALAKLMQKAGEDFVILGDQEKCCGCMSMTSDSGASERLKQENLAALTKARLRRLAIACGSCLRVWREHVKVADADLEVLYGVEYLETPLRAGQLRITNPIFKKLLITIPVIWAAVAAYTKRRATFCAPFPVSRLWR